MLHDVVVASTGGDVHARTFGRCACSVLIMRERAHVPKKPQHQCLPPWKELLYHGMEHMFVLWELVSDVLDFNFTDATWCCGSTHGEPVDDVVQDAQEAPVPLEVEDTTAVQIMPVESTAASRQRHNWA